MLRGLCDYEYGFQLPESRGKLPPRKGRAYRLKQWMLALKLAPQHASIYFHLLVLSQHDPFNLAAFYLTMGIYITSAFVLFHFQFSMPASDMSGYIVLFPILLLIYCRILLADKSCYNPDQAIPSRPYYPCNTASGVHSACCGFGDQCTEQGYCFGSAGYLYRGGCTDITWESPNCAQQCKAGTQPQEEHHLPKRIWLTL